MANGTPTNGPSLSWANIISTLVFGAVVLSGQYLLTQQQLASLESKFQQQFATLAREITEAKATEDRIDVNNSKNIAEINAELSKRKDVFRQEFVTRDEFRIEEKRRDDRWRDEDAKDVRLQSEIDGINKELGVRRSEFVTVVAFQQHQERILDDIKVLREQLRVLEQTRPSTGELQAATNSLKDRIDKLYELLARQEEWIKTLTKPVVPK